MHSVADLHEHLERLAEAHRAHSEHITAEGDRIHAELERSRAAGAEGLPEAEQAEVSDGTAEADHPAQ
jgi:hypothetical protein